MTGREEMDWESIDKSTRHIRSVQRIESELASLSAEELAEQLEALSAEATTRWESCHRSYRALFGALNKGNGWRQANFDIRLQRAEIDDKQVDTYFHVWYERPSDTYNVRLYIALGNGIYDHSEVKESFSKVYEYRHDTRYSKSAKLAIDYDGREASLSLQRIDGYSVRSDTLHTKAIFCAAVQDGVIPELENTEDTLLLLWSAVLDDDLNPELARRVRQMDL
jgi:hypothetical protein